MEPEHAFGKVPAKVSRNEFSPNGRWVKQILKRCQAPAGEELPGRLMAFVHGFLAIQALPSAMMAGWIWLICSRVMVMH